jgi:hypothetical protein
MFSGFSTSIQRRDRNKKEIQPYISCMQLANKHLDSS